MRSPAPPRRRPPPIGVKIALDPARVGTILGQMQNTASLPADQFEELLRRLPAALDPDRLARQTKAIERKRTLDSGADLLRLALARGPGGLSLSETAAWATMLGFAEMSDPAVKYRLDKAVEFLDAVMVALVGFRGVGLDHLTSAVMRAPSRALPRRRALCTN